MSLKLINEYVTTNDRRIWLAKVPVAPLVTFVGSTLTEWCLLRAAASVAFTVYGGNPTHRLVHIIVWVAIRHDQSYSYFK
jgi:hypothetical protein